MPRIEQIGPFVYPRFAPSPGALQARAAHQESPVLIVGGGPVGLALALGLARHGVRSIVAEADDSVCEGSRAACISRRSLEILERLGVAGRFLSKGLPWTTGRSYYRTEEVLVFEMPHGPRQKYPPMINLQQYYVEQFLVDEVRRLNAAQPGCIELCWATRVVGFVDRDDHVQVELENGFGRGTRSVRWLAACDGGQSFVRNALGLKLSGTTYQGRYVIVDIELPSTHLTERRAWFDPPWAPGITILMHRQPDDIWRVDFQLRPGESAEEALEPTHLHAFVQTHLDAIGEGHLPWHPVWSSIYRAGAMTLDSYRHGRIFFAGNAAHALPIFGVRGLNSGFDDADNLAWKLAAVVNGRAGEELLDTYSFERVQAFHANAASAMRSTEFMSPPSRGFDLLREACLSLAGRHRDLARLVNPRQTSAITYGNSPLSSLGDALPEGPAPGAPLEDMALSAGGHLTDLLHPAGFTVLVFGPHEMASRAAQSLRPTASEYVTIVQVPPDPQLEAAHGCRGGSIAVYAVRPDGHVAGRWRRADSRLIEEAVRRASCSREREIA